VAGVKDMSIKAILFGASGMVGEGVLLKALDHPAVESVLVIGRRSCGVQHPKLREVIHNNFFDYFSLEQQLVGYSACWFCLGVSSVGKSHDVYRHLTYDLTMAAAQVLSRLNPGMTFCYVSGQGTDSTEQGKMAWARVKGKTENDLRKLPFKAAYAFRPGFIKPYEGLKNSYRISKILGGIYPLMKLLFPGGMCTMEDLALSMIRVSTKGYSSPILENKDIALLAAAKE
jgi:hypothetical protein